MTWFIVYSYSMQSSMTEQRTLPHGVLWDALFNLISVQGDYVKTVLSSHFKKKFFWGDWMARSSLEFNPGWGGLVSVSSRWLSIGQLEMNGVSSA